MHSTLAELPADATIEPAAPNVEPEVVTAQPSRWRQWAIWRHRHAIVVVLLTLFAGFIRFAWIDRPSLWNDEAHTYRRVTGTFQEMLETIKTEGFAPLNYEWYWWLAQKLGGGGHLSPFWMRLLPALCGTLMVPAMYFMARQFCSKRTSLFTAAYAACSAYLMVYSHDAKMYMQLWLFVALSIGSLLWWFRTHRRVAWLAWVASSLAIGAMHAPGLIVLAFQPLMFFTQRSVHWKKFILFIVGLGVIGAGPAGHYLGFDRWVDQVDDNWSSAGLSWVPGILRGRDGGNLTIFVTSAYLYSWEWPSDSYNDDAQYKSYRNTSSALSLMLQGFNIDPRVMTGLMSAIILTLVLAAIGALPWPAQWRGASPDDPPRQPPWRSALWLLPWLIVPVYGFYCISVEDFAAPRDWIDSVTSIINGKWWIFGGMLLVLCSLMMFVRRTAGILAISVGAILLIALGTAIYQSRKPLASTPAVAQASPPSLRRASRAPVVAPEAAQPPSNEWWRFVRRVGRNSQAFLATPTAALRATPSAEKDRRIYFLALLIAAALIWHYSARTPQRRLLYAVQVVVVVSVTLLLCYGVSYAILERRKTNPEVNMSFISRYMGAVWPAFAVILCALLMRLPTRPLRYFAVVLLLGTNLAQAYGRMFLGSEPPVDLQMKDVWASQPSDATVRAYVQNGPGNAHPAGGTIFNRPGKYYISWISNDPFTPREFMGAEITSRATVWTTVAPMSIAADVRRNPRISRVIVWDRLVDDPRAHLTDIKVNGTTVTATSPSHIYMRGDRIQISGSDIPEFNGTFTITAATPTTIEFTLPSAPSSVPKTLMANLPETLQPALGADWKQTHENIYPVRYHWNWSHLYSWRRREYQKLAAD